MMRLAIAASTATAAPMTAAAAAMTASTNTGGGSSVIECFRHADRERFEQRRDGGQRGH